MLRERGSFQKNLRGLQGQCDRRAQWSSAPTRENRGSDY